MKTFSFLLMILFLLPAILLADGKNKKAGKKPPADVQVKQERKEIEWITSMEELEAKMNQNPKKVYVDVYTTWCGWCRTMDAATFSNHELIKYMNKYFYAVRVNAERKDVIHFRGNEYRYDPKLASNTFAFALLHGDMHYPTSIFMLEHYQSPKTVKGYQPIADMEFLLTYYGDNAYVNQTWDVYRKTHRATWENGIAHDTMPPVAH